MSDEPIDNKDDSLDTALLPEPVNEEMIEMTKQDLMNSWKRTAADFDNYKKRKEQEGMEFLQYAKELSVMKLMPPLQSLEQVLRFAPADDKYKDWLIGLKATVLQLEKAMEELGVTKIRAVGEKFDHSLHEAVEETDEVEEGLIAKEIQPGFMLSGKVIVPAKVAVGKKSNLGQRPIASVL